MKFTVALIAAVSAIGRQVGRSGHPESEIGLKKFDDDEIFEEEDVATISFSDEELSEDSEGEETYHYGDDEGADREEEEHLEDEEKMAPADRIKEIERHLDALKKDMGYDEDHEDRDEEGTDFYEQKTFKVKKGGKIINISESDIKKLSNLLKEETKRGKGCAESEGGSGCIKKGKYVDKDGTEYPWHILNNKHGGVFKGCTSKKDCESILRVPGVHRG